MNHESGEPVCNDKIVISEAMQQTTIEPFNMHQSHS